MTFLDRIKLNTFGGGNVIAKLYRMKTKDHLCPYGLKSKALLEREGYEVEDHLLTTRAEVDQFKSKWDVSTTPQTFIQQQSTPHEQNNNENNLIKRVGGYDDLKVYLGKEEPKSATDKNKDETSYKPIIHTFSVALLSSLALQWGYLGGITFLETLISFVALAMILLATLKMQNLSTFSNQFITYDLVGKKEPRYAYIYPYCEALIGLSMLSGILMPVIAPLSITMGAIGSVSVIKAVYIDKRELKCACVGGDSNVPLGFVSLSENLAMLIMGFAMLVM